MVFCVSDPNSPWTCRGIGENSPYTQWFSTGGSRVDLIFKESCLSVSVCGLLFTSPMITFTQKILKKSQSIRAKYSLAK